MSELFAVSSPELEQVQLVIYPLDAVSGEVANQPVEITRWTSYVFEGEYTTPTDAFQFTLGLDRPEDVSFRMRDIKPGSKCALTIAGHPQATGFIDAVEYSTSRSGGITVNVIGRDALGRCVDANSDPSVAFKTGQTIEDFLATLFAPYGFTSFPISNDDNRALQTGMQAGLRYKKSKKHFGEPLKKKSMHQLKPYSGEGLFQFAARVAQRQGLWLRPDASGSALVASTPDFDGDPTFRLRRSVSTQENNMLSCSVRADIGAQPTIILADGFGGGGEFGKSKIKSMALNPSLITFDPEQDKIIERYRDAKLLTLTPHANPIAVPKTKPLYLHDDESKTQEQLDKFVRRELALLRKKALTVRVTVEGHGQIVDGTFVPWAVDTLVDFADEVSGIIEPLWILGRSFHKSRGGTTTDLQLIRPFTLEF